MRSLIKNEIDTKIFHRRIEKFFHDLGETMDLINEKDIPSFKMSQNADEISPFSIAGPEVVTI